MIKNADRIYHGGDYNPDQWDDATIDEDMRLFKQAGINLVTLPVFAWAKLEPEEGVYDFEWLDKLMDKFAENDIGVCMATPTTAQPAWLSRKYPEIMPVDKQGRKRTHGMRVFFCVNSEKYRERAAAIAEQMAKRYAKHPALKMWHIANEYGTYCYCPNCEKKFRNWLKGKYGTIENLNEKWHTSFWGKQVYDFEDIRTPSELNDDNKFNPILNLEYTRFMTESTISCFENEAMVIREYCPDMTIQTNISGHIEKLNQFEMVKHMDIAAWDNYPAPNHDKSFAAFRLDLMRGLKDGESFMMQEQSPNQQNWQQYAKLKRPGELRMLSYQAMAHGSDTCLYFQLRQSIAGEEMYHGAVISHAGSPECRTFKEVSQIGAELKKIGDVFLGGRTHSDAAMIFDWDNWWSLEFASKRCLPIDNFNYLKKMERYHKVLFEENIPMDVISVDTDFSKYKVIIAPYIFMLKEGLADKLNKFVEEGGTLITSIMAGNVDEYHRAIFGAYPGPLRKSAGIWVEETDALYKEEKIDMVMKNDFLGGDKAYTCMTACDIIHTEGAEVLAEYGSEFYAGTPCLTVNKYGKGKCYYIATEPDNAFLQDFLLKVLADNSISAPYDGSDNMEITVRENDRYRTVFALNRSRDEEGTIELGNETFEDKLTGEKLTGTVNVPAYDVRILVR